MKPLVAVSKCLLGEPVRYDGQHMRQAWLVEELAEYIDILPVCPEVAAGLGVPRPPVQLVNTPDGVKAKGVDDPILDVTELIQSYSEDFLPELERLSAVILKSRSPSCGIESTPLYNVQGEILKTTSGLFAEAIKRHKPDLLVVDEQLLSDAAERDRFLTSLT